MNNNRTESGAKNKIHKVCPCEASCDNVRYHNNKCSAPYSNGRFLYTYATRVLFVITGISPFHLQGLCGKKFPVCSLSVVSNKRYSVSSVMRIAFQSGIWPTEFVMDFLNATFCSDVVHGPIWRSLFASGDGCVTSFSAPIQQVLTRSHR